MTHGAQLPGGEGSEQGQPAPIATRRAGARQGGGDGGVEHVQAARSVGRRPVAQRRQAAHGRVVPPLGSEGDEFVEVGGGRGGVAGTSGG